MKFRFAFGSVLVGLVLSLGVHGNKVAAQSVGANNTDIKASMAGSNPLSLMLRLKNDSTRACQVATTAQGTIAITNVTQDGKQLSATPLNTASDDDLGYLLQSQLTTLNPGQSVDVPLLIYKVKDAYILRSTTWSSDAGSFGSQYAIQSNKPLALDLNYSLPITPSHGAPACSDVFFAGTAKHAGRLQLILKITVAVVIVIIVLLFCWWLSKRKHKTTASVAVLCLVVGAVMWHQAPRALADISVPASVQSAFDTCMATLNANRDLTGPVLDVINDPANHIIIVPITGTGSDMTGYDHTFTIYWNPNDHHPYAGTGGNADPCTTLYHEMYHAYDMSHGTFSRDDCAGSGIETKEVMATRAQNALRVRLGLPPRSHYGNRPLPSGDCSAPAAGPQCSGTHCASTNGDPHLRTFDGLLYDFQGAGEFIAAQDKMSDYVIQVRQQPWANSRYVAINTAVAMKADGDVVEVRAGQDMSLLVNGKQQSLADSTLPKGDKIAIEDNAIVVTWADGSQAWVRSVGRYGLALSAQLSDARAGKVDGLLGNANGDPKNDLHVQGSTQAIEPTFKTLYPTFADSWRITSSTSLFTYDSGMSTASYTNHNFPDQLPPPTGLPGYAGALAFCKSFNITDPEVLADCALDVAITGRPEFARAASVTQMFTAGSNYGGTTWNVVIKNPGDKATLTFDAKAGDKIFVDIPQTTLGSQCGVISLLAPDGSQVSDGCIINGSGEIDGTVLPSTGQYTIRIAPDSSTGVATVRLLRITDLQGTITPDGPLMTVNIDRPGVVGRYTFTGQANEHVYLDMPKSTLANECGILRILAPDGSVLSSGCVINGAGNIDTTTLPTDGQYMIVVDPNDTITGVSQMRLVVSTATTQPISINGPSVVVNLAKPGSTARFTFNGVAGQKIFADIVHSDLPNECGLFRLLAPDGTEVTNGCVINNTGGLSDSAVTLSATGQYTLVLDPGGGATGASTILVRDH